MIAEYLPKLNVSFTFSTQAILNGSECCTLKGWHEGKEGIMMDVRPLKKWQETKLLYTKRDWYNIDWEKNDKYPKNWFGHMQWRPIDGQQLKW